jgi:cell division protein FtsQ
LEILIKRPVEDRRLRRGRTARLLGAVAVLVVIAGGVAMSRTSLLRARAIEVTGHSVLSRAAVVAISGLDRHTNVLWFDEEVAERRLESNAWVADAVITVSLPSTIRIAVIERIPVAVASDWRGDMLVAGDGTSLGSPERPADARGLPLISLAPTRIFEGSSQSPEGAALALGSMDPGLRASVVRVSVLFDGTLEVWLRSGPRIHFGGPSGFAPKSRAISQALAWAEAEGEQLLSLSVVSPAAPAATLAP